MNFKAIFGHFWRPLLWLVLTILVVLCRAGPPGYSYGEILEHATRPAKVKAFVACRKECIQRCDRLVYKFERNQYHCHKCLEDCMRLFLQQAQSVGVSFGKLKGAKTGKLTKDRNSLNNI